jgi:hypothetical protein
LLNKIVLPVPLLVASGKVIFKELVDGVTSIILVAKLTLVEVSSGQDNVILEDKATEL